MIKAVSYVFSCSCRKIFSADGADFGLYEMYSSLKGSFLKLESILYITWLTFSADRDFYCSKYGACVLIGVDHKGSELNSFSVCL